MRSDILVSVGVVDEAGPRLTIPRLGVLVKGLGKAFEYFEVVYVVEEQARAELQSMADQIAHLTNLRIILTSEGTPFYRQRLIAAREAIGDVVALLDFDEVTVEDLITQIGRSKDRSQILIGWRPSRPSHGWSYRLLSLASRHIITTQAARTIVLPRELLNATLLRQSAVLDLRFEARVPVSRYHRFNIASPVCKGVDLSQRYELLTEILLCGAPRYLKAYAALGFLVVMGAIVYGIYAMGVILIRRHVQEGWFSTAIIQAGSTAFIAGGMSILSIALTAIVENLQGTSNRVVVDELSNTSFFEAVTKLNVELCQALASIPQQDELPHEIS